MRSISRIFNRFKKPIYVLDTSALGCEEVINLINEDCIVILTSVTLKELDYRKKVGNSKIFKSRVSKVLYESARDLEAKKYKIVEIKNEWKVDKEDITNISRNDDSILEFCKTNKNYILLTADNGMATKARAMKINYRIFDVDPKIIVEEKNNKSKENPICHLDGTRIKNGRLMLQKSNSFFKQYLVLNKNLTLKFSLEKNEIRLNRGDQVCVATSNNENKAKFSFYEITDITDEKNAKYKYHFKIRCIDEIDTLTVSETVKNFMRDFMKRV